MNVVFFDLGNTLIGPNDQPLPGAMEMLDAVSDLTDADGHEVVIALISDYTMGTTETEKNNLIREYYGILRQAGLESNFTPLSERVTISTEVGVRKPDRKIFEAATKKLNSDLELHHCVFITENADHIHAARELGLMAVHFKGPGQQNGEVETLPELVPVISRLIAFSPCCKKHGQGGGHFKSVANSNKIVDPSITNYVNQISGDRLRKAIVHLEGFGTRWTFSNGIEQVPGWIHDQFIDIGYSDTGAPQFQPFDLPNGTTQHNVLCGPKNPTVGFVLLCAHYDALSETPSTKAPGADDNASGIAVMLEIAKLLQGTKLTRGIRYAAFGGEEQGLFGSEACAEAAEQGNWPIDVVINLDMIAYQSPQRIGHIVVEYDQGNRNPDNDAAAKAFGLMMAQAAADYTSLKVEHTDIWNSDYIPFERKGYACIGVYEASENPDYHKTGDTLDKIEIPHLVEITKMVLATILQIAQ